MIRQSESIVKLSAAFVAAQAEMSHAARDSKNPHFRSNYASLAACLDACQPALNKHGIGIMQGTSRGEGRQIVVTTRLVHQSGEWMESDLSLSADKDNEQGAGSAISYARRYALCGLVGISDVDDDGNEASRSPRKPEPPKPPPHQKHPSFAKDQGRFFARLKEMEFDYDMVCLFCNSLGRPRPSAMDTAQRDKLLDYLNDEGAEAFVAFEAKALGAKS